MDRQGDPRQRRAGMAGDRRAQPRLGRRGVPPPALAARGDQLRQTVADYRATQFGGWPWGGPDPVHDRREGRFALHADGRVEHRDMQPATG